MGTMQRDSKKCGKVVLGTAAATAAVMGHIMITKEEQYNSAASSSLSSC